MPKQTRKGEYTPTAEDVNLYRVFTGTPAGLQALNYLRAMFFDNSTFVPQDPHRTSYNIGKQDAIGFILEAIALVEKAGQGEGRIIT